MKNHKQNYIVRALSLALLMPMAVIATESQKNIRLEEIVVTAQKREQSVQDIPVAISAFSADQMERFNITNSQDLEHITPGLITGSMAGYAQTFIRGVGSTITIVNADSSVATFIDGYYLAFIQGTMQELYDAERVEVLKGPQATLYGRNASGGAINYVSRKPNMDVMEGKVSFGYGSDDEKEVKGFVTGPITDTLAFSASALVRERDSYLDLSSASFDQDTEENVWAGRLKFLWQPNDWYQAELSASFSDSESFENAAFMPMRGSVAEAALLGATVTYADSNKVTADTPIFNNTEQGFLFLTQEAELNDLTIRSLTGVTYTKNDTSSELDGSTLNLLGSDNLPARSRQVSQEFQILSDPTQQFSWILGASYFKAIEEFDPNSQSLSLPSQLLGLYAQQFTDTRLETETSAIFAEGSYQFTDRLTLTAGARWTDEEKELTDGRLWWEGIPNPAPFLDCTFAGLTFGVDCGGAAFGLPPIPAAFVGSASTLNGVRQQIPSESTSWEELTYKVSLQYAITDDVNVYYSHSRGFKGGVYNLPAVSPAGPNDPVNPELLDSNEIGLKGDFWDGRLRVNASAFMYDLTDTQAQVIQSSAAGITVLSSAGDSSLKGAELEIFMAATERLYVTAGLAYLDTEYKDFDNYPAQVALVPGGGMTGAGGNATVNTSVVGGDMVRAPELTANLAATYTIPMEDYGYSGTLSLSGIWSYNDGYCFESACNLVQDSYNVVNASVSYATADEAWEITAWVNNLFDEEYFRQALQVPTADLALMQRPTHGGIKVEYNF